MFWFAHFPPSATIADAGFGDAKGLLGFQAIWAGSEPPSRTLQRLQKLERAPSLPSSHHSFVTSGYFCCC